jgi:hypothetical protein
MLMGWVWDQSAGELRRDGKLVSKGYAGYRATAMTGDKNSPNTGPFTIVLEPEPGTDTCGRSAFRIHGDNSRGDRSASHGCIILPRTVRETIWRSGQRLIEVIA